MTVHEELVFHFSVVGSSSGLDRCIQGPRQTAVGRIDAELGETIDGSMISLLG